MATTNRHPPTPAPAADPASPNRRLAQDAAPTQSANLVTIIAAPRADRHRQQPGFIEKSAAGGGENVGRSTYDVARAVDNACRDLRRRRRGALRGVPREIEAVDRHGTQLVTLDRLRSATHGPVTATPETELRPIHNHSTKSLDITNPDPRAARRPSRTSQLAPAQKTTARKPYDVLDGNHKRRQPKAPTASSTPRHGLATEVDAPASDSSS